MNHDLDNIRVDFVRVDCVDQAKTYLPWTLSDGRSVLIDRRLIYRHYSGGSENQSNADCQDIYDLVESCEALAIEAIEIAKDGITPASGLVNRLNAAGIPPAERNGKG